MSSPKRLAVPVLQILAVAVLIATVCYWLLRARAAEERLKWTPAVPSVSQPLPARQCRATILADGQRRQCRNRTRDASGLCWVHRRK